MAKQRWAYSGLGWRGQKVLLPVAASSWYSHTNSFAKAKLSRAKSNRHPVASLKFVFAKIINSLASEVKGALPN